MLELMATCRISTAMHHSQREKLPERGGKTAPPAHQPGPCECHRVEPAPVVPVPAVCPCPQPTQHRRTRQPGAGNQQRAPACSELLSSSVKVLSGALSIPRDVQHPPGELSIPLDQTEPLHPPQGTIHIRVCTSAAPPPLPLLPGELFPSIPRLFPSIYSWGLSTQGL